jgi:hypothetical protein
MIYKFYYTILLIIITLLYNPTLLYSYTIKTDIGLGLITEKVEYNDNSRSNSIINGYTSISNFSVSSDLTHKESKLILGPLLELSRDEDYAQSSTLGMQIGYGNLSDHTFLFGASWSYKKHLRVNEKTGHGVNTFCYLGRQEYTHLNIINNNGGLGLLLVPIIHPTNKLEIELALGYKKLLPVYLFFNFKGSSVMQSNSFEEKETQLLYKSALGHFHLIYYGKRIYLSAGYTSYGTGYYLAEHNGNYWEEIQTYREEKYNGFGTTGKIKNIFSKKNSILFEYALMKNKSGFLNEFSFGIEFIFSSI